MLEKTLFALLPIIVTIGLGIFSAKLGHFNDQDASKLTTLTLKYALPLSVFEGTASTSKKLLIADLPLVIWIFSGIIVCFFIILFFCQYILKIKGPRSALISYTISNPSIPFIGSAILPLLFGGTTSAIDIGASTLLMNILIVPITLGILDTTNLKKRKKIPFSFFKRIENTLKNPLVFSAIAGFLIILFDWQLPEKLQSTFTVLGKAAGGLALFTIGVILYFRKFRFSKTISILVLMKNIIFPTIIWIIMIFLKTPLNLRRIVVITLAIPVATLPTSLAIQYKLNEEEMASTQLISTIFSFITLSAFMLIV